MILLIHLGDTSKEYHKTFESHHGKRVDCLPTACIIESATIAGLSHDHIFIFALDSNHDSTGHGYTVKIFTHVHANS